jgi:hypothetical protein
MVQHVLSIFIFPGIKSRLVPPENLPFSALIARAQVQYPPAKMNIDRATKRAST